MEFAKLLWEQVIWEDDYLNICGRGAPKHGSIGKHGKARRVPIHPALRELLLRAYDTGVRASGT